MRSKFIVILLVGLFGGSSISQTDLPKTRIGVVEFKLENQIDLDNAGNIVAQWLASELVRIGRYEITERLDLQNILDEQDLGLLGVLDDATAAQIGRLHGVQGIVTGSVMQIGSTISVTGKIINAETGQVLKSSSVRAANLDALALEIEVLANALSDINRAEFEIRRDVTKRSLAYMSIGGELTLAGSYNDGSDLSEFGIGVAASGSYTGPKFSAWLDGTPIGSIKGLHVGASHNLSPIFGLAGEIGFISDGAIDFVSVNYFALGITMQPRHELLFRILFGGTTSGTIWLWDDSDPDGEKEKVDGYFSVFPPAAYSVHVQYRLSGGYTLVGRMTGADLQDYKLTHYPDPLGEAYSSYAFILGIQREFAVDF
ncbi:CsgG/HfaB family protein [Candidatus Neomarinimicrobiota bacterium]